MLHNIKWPHWYYILMAKGSSGRIVIEIEPELKQELYGVLEREGLNLKRWFLENVEDYLRNRMQLPLELDLENDKTKEINSQ
mgnify:CR=1 FL=1